MPSGVITVGKMAARFPEGRRLGEQFGAERRHLWQSRDLRNACYSPRTELTSLFDSTVPGTVLERRVFVTVSNVTWLPVAHGWRPWHFWCHYQPSPKRESRSSQRHGPGATRRQRVGRI